MKIVQIGTQFNTIPRINFYSDHTFLEYDALIIDISAIADNSHHCSINFFQKRKNNLSEFIDVKKIPIIYFVPESDVLSVKAGNVLQNYLLDVILPIPAIQTDGEVGKDIKVVTKTPFSDFLEKNKAILGYKRFYNKSNGTPIVITPFTNKVLAFYTEDAVFLPQIKSLNNQQEEEFLIELFECVKKVRFDPSANPLPKWTESYFLPGEHENKQKVNQLNEQIEKLRLEVEKVNAEIETITNKKRLFTATGEELELKVEEIFRELGFEILQAEKSRDDLILKYGEDIAVVEIKGLNNSSGEKNAAQLEKWRATYLEVHGVDPKGILLVNTYRETPLAERNQPDFPDQMLRYSVSREHCLITTLQLLALYYEIVKNPERKEVVIKSLFDTVGRYDANCKWQNYIKNVES